MSPAPVAGYQAGNATGSRKSLVAHPAPPHSEVDNDMHCAFQ
jgi:hypothetical protein